MNTRNLKNLLLIFARNPVLGKTKTRLAKTIGDENALAVYRILLNHTVSETIAIRADKRVCYADFIDSQDVWRNDVFQKQKQNGSDLGERMRRAFEDAFAEGYQKVIVIGTDLLDLKTELLENAFASLDDFDVVIGPAADGGYYLLGLKAPIVHIFENKAWGTDTVLRDTLSDLETKSVCLLETLNDIDTENDLLPYEALLKFTAKKD
ncbi:MAG: TIGR04282 family arsenosugar biosynthesis glycosyltransferase [Flavobacteriaceae bacterium]|nr:TIGR04282 family arsenosugar biosynthesis glycosyltransferase [Flavobacteriaceae bacterium]